MQAGRVHRAGGQAVAAHALRHRIGRHRPRHADHRRLGGAIDEAVGRAFDRAGGTGHIDDRAAPAFEHGRQCGGQHLPHRPHIQREGEIPFVIGAGQRRILMHEAGAIEQHIKRPGGRHHARHRRVIEHIQRLGLDARLGQARELVQVAVGCHHAGALGRHGEGRGPAHALAGRGDENTFSGEPSGHGGHSCSGKGYLSR